MLVDFLPSFNNFSHVFESELLQPASVITIPHCGSTYLLGSLCRVYKKEYSFHVMAGDVGDSSEKSFGLDFSRNLSAQLYEDGFLKQFLEVPR